MKKLFFLLALLCASLAHAQNVRWDLGTPGSAGVVTTGAGSYLVALSGVSLAWCTYPANAVPCTNYANTYPSLSSATPCPTNAQIVLQGSNTCVGTSDNFGNLGVYTTAGTYSYTLTANGQNYGPFTVTVSPPYILLAPGSTISYSAVPSTGGVIYLLPGSYSCPPPPPPNVSLINWSAGANATVAGLGFDGVTGVNTQVTFTNCTSGWTVTGSNTRVENITLDFANSGTGVVFKGAQFNRWKQVTLLNCGNTTTPCWQFAGFGAGPPGNAAFNTCEDCTINPNMSSGQYAGCVQALGNAFSGTNSAVGNSFFRLTCVGNVLYVYSAEGGGGGGGTDSNSFYYTQAIQMSSAFTSYLLELNTLNASAQVDADGTSFYDLDVTGPFNYVAKLGQSSGTLVMMTNLGLATPYVIVGGTPRITLVYRGAGASGANWPINGKVGAFASAALGFPAATNDGDLWSAESATAGCVGVGSDGTTEICRSGNQFNFTTTQASFFLDFPGVSHLGFTAANGDVNGRVTISSATSQDVPFVYDYNAEPTVQLTPKGDTTACGTFWYTVDASNAGFTAHVKNSCTITFSYWIFGDAN